MTQGVSLQWDGLDEFKKAIHAAPNVALKSIRGTLYRQAGAIMTRSLRLTPIDKGPLRASRFWNRPVQTITGEISVTMGYGGAASAYALAVHEYPSGYDPKSWRRHGLVHFQSGGPKYLERPFDDARKRVLAAVSRDVSKALKAKAGF